jgi:hypothetical protein
MFPTDILAEFQAPLVQSLHKMNVPNGSHFGRVSGPSCAGNAQDEVTAFATLHDFRFMVLAVIFHGRPFQQFDGSIYFRLTS